MKIKTDPAKRVFQIHANSKGTDQPAHPLSDQGLNCSSTETQNTSTNNKDPDRIVQMRRLIWAYIDPRSPKILFHIMLPPDTWKNMNPAETQISPRMRMKKSRVLDYPQQRPSRPRWLSWMRRPTGDQKVASSTLAEVGNILLWRLIMKYFLRSFSPFRGFKKGSCQFLVKECAHYWLTA